MRKILSTLLLMFLFTGIKAQSLQETQLWILSKLSKYQREFFGIRSGDCDYTIQKSNYSFRFEKDTFIVTCDVKPIFPSCFKGDKSQQIKNTATKSIEKIPISDINSIKSPDNWIHFRIGTRLHTIRTIATFSSGNVESYSDGVFIGLNLNTEDNLLERLQKAFNHLTTFYPKKEKKEAF